MSASPWRQGKHSSNLIRRAKIIRIEDAYVFILTTHEEQRYEIPKLMILIAVFLGQKGGLDTVAYMKFLENVGDVMLDRLFGQE